MRDPRYRLVWTISTLVLALAVRLWFQPRRQHRRVDQIGEKYCEQADFTKIGWRGQQILGVGVHFTNG